MAFEAKRGGGVGEVVMGENHITTVAAAANGGGGDNANIDLWPGDGVEGVWGPLNSVLRRRIRCGRFCGRLVLVLGWDFPAQYYTTL